MLSKVRWGEVEIGSLFDGSNGDYDIQKKHINGNGIYVISAGLSNNGVIGKTDVNARIFDKNTITIDMFGNVFYRNYEYKLVTHARVFSLKCNRNVSYRQLIFISNTMNFLSKEYGYDNMCSFEKIRSRKIYLPIKKDNTIDFDFMDTFISELEAYHISELEAYHISELEAYLLVTGLKNYKLNKDELCAVERIHNNEIKWKEVRIVDRFSVKNTSNILSEEIVENSGDIPYLGATSQNNGILSYITYDEKYKDSGECVFIGGKTFVVTYQENDFYSNDSHNLVLYYNDIVQKNKLNNLFFCTSIKKSLGHKYSWGNSISKSKIQSDYMMLPVDDKDDVDYDFMKHLISAVQKLVIKDVVIYSDEKIKATKQVVNNGSKVNEAIKDTIFNKKLAAHIDVGNLIDKLDSN